MIKFTTRWHGTDRILVVGAVSLRLPTFVCLNTVAMRVLCKLPDPARGCVTSFGFNVSDSLAASVAMQPSERLASAPSAVLPSPWCQAGTRPTPALAPARGRTDMLRFDSSCLF